MKTFVIFIRETSREKKVFTGRSIVANDYTEARNKAASLFQGKRVSVSEVQVTEAIIKGKEENTDIWKWELRSKGKLIYSNFELSNVLEYANNYRIRVSNKSYLIPENKYKLIY